ncbi:MAG: thermonuclease family protein [bacterium]
MKKVNYISRLFNLLLIILILPIAFYLQKYAPKDKPNENKLNLDKATVVQVIDGDTIKVKINNQIQTVRLIGIDTPESTENKKLTRDSQRTQLSEQQIIQMGLKSKQFTKNVITPIVYLEYDIQKHDKYGRILAYVYLENGQMLNYILVKEGYAKVYTIPPNVKYQEKFIQAQKEAQTNQKGLWKLTQGVSIP